MEYKRSGYPSISQKEMLISEMKKRPQLVSGRFSSNFTKKDGQKEWQEISEILNGIPGAMKDWIHWRKCWQDIRCKAKKQKAVITQHARGTGGGPPLPTSSALSATDESVLEMINPVSCSGHDNTKESIVDFDFGNGIVSFEPNNNVPFDLESIVPFQSDMEVIISDHDYEATTKVENLTGKKSVKNTPSLKSKMTPKRSATKRLQCAASATESLAKQSKLKLEMKRDYYAEKLKIMKQKEDREAEFAKQLLRIEEKKLCLLEEINNKLNMYLTLPK